LLRPDGLASKGKARGLMALCAADAAWPRREADGIPPPSYSFSLKTQTPKPGRSTPPFKRKTKART